jgi:hypothetical protein
MNDLPEIRPCPFCGGVPIYVEEKPGFLRVQNRCTPDCGSQGVGGLWGKKRNFLRELKKWNTRVK